MTTTGSARHDSFRTLTALALLLATAPGALAAQERDPHLAERPLHHAVRIQTAPAIDGRLDEAVWADAPVVSDFVQYDPDEGQPASERTEVRILYDRDALYIGARLYDRGQVQTRLGRRDMSLLDSDWFGVVIDSYHDHRTGFVFDVNPSGVQRDAVKSVTGDGESDDGSWDAVWEVETSIDEDGWTAEYRIPFSQIRFRDGDEPQSWGLLLERVIGRRGEYSLSSFVPKTERGGIPSYGHLLGIEDVDQGNPLELLPYTVARSEHVDPGQNAFRTDSEQAITAGVDLRYRVTSSLTLNATINPDFGQVEVDPAVVNLGVYEVFFEERRPFFVEGSEIFDFGRNTSGGSLFYSRRIGRTPQLRAPSPTADNPTSTRILGAAKFTGKTADGWNIGLIEAVTAQESARWYDSEGTERSFTSEPLTSYFVGRARRDLRGGLTSIGGMLTATHRDLDAPEAAAALRGSAWAGGVDFRHEFAERAWVLAGTVMGSHVSGTPSAIERVQRAGNHFFQRPDADHLEVDPEATSLTGYSLGASIARQAGQHWRGNLAVAATSPAFEVNDLGFQTRTDRRDLQAGITRLETQPGELFRNWAVSASHRLEHNYDGQKILQVSFLTANARMLNFWNAHLRLGRFHRALDDRSTRGGPLMIRPASTMIGGNLSTDDRRPLILGTDLSFSRTEYEGWSAEGGMSFTWRSDRWNLSTGPRFATGLQDAQYVTTLEDRSQPATYGRAYLFAPIELTEFSLVTRLNVTFTPRLSLETFLQPFVSTGDYGRVAQLARPSSFEFEERPDLEDQLPDLDFALRSLRGTAVLRWEWRPGSTLYLAWQQQRADVLRGRGDFRFGPDLQGMLDAQPDNIFVLKINYWITP